ncbi:MAG: multi-sensor signal transduction histidine kinase, partial [Polaromonas sp.]|nr:multi-sensor signal transduction histidine kinase [Polaromonas sp.]
MNASVSPPRLNTSLVLLLVVALLPLFGLVTYTSLQNQHDSLGHARDHLLDAARLTALRYERTVEGARQLLGAIASAPPVKNYELPQCKEYLKSLHGKYPFYTNLGLLDLNGNLVCQAVDINGTRFWGDRSYFKEALATQSFVIGEYIIGRTSGRPAITFAMPVVDDKGDLRGVAFAALELGKLAGGQPLTAPSAVNVIVTDRKGVLVGADPPSASRIGAQALDTALFAAVKALPTQAFDAVDQNGEARIYAAVGVG